MKKLFTLVASMMMAMSSMAAETVLLEGFTLDSWGASKTFTSSDAKKGDFIKIVVDEAPSGCQLILKNTSYGDVLPGAVDPVENKVIYYRVTDDILNLLQGGGLMFQGNGGVQVGQVSLLPSEDLEKIVAYEGPGEIKSAWGSVTVSKANFNFVKEGDIVVIETTNNTETPKGENFLFKKDGYGDAAHIYDLINPWCISLTDEWATGYFGEKDNNIQAAKSGIIVNSVDIYRLKENVPSKKTVLTDTPTELGNFSGSVIIAADNFADAKVGDEIRVELTNQVKTTSYDAQIKFATNADGWPLLNDDVNCLNIPTVPVFVYAIPDAETLSTLKATGLIIQGKNATVNSVSLYTSDAPTGISNATVAPAAKSSKIYNLAGQQVDASYKGVVIKNGKKYVQ